MSVKDFEREPFYTRLNPPGSRTLDALSADSEQAPTISFDWQIPPIKVLDLQLLSPDAHPPSDARTSSWREEMESGAVPLQLASLFRWLPPVGTETTAECRLGNRFKEYLNATSDLDRQLCLGGMKKEALAVGPKGFDLVRACLAFDAGMRLLQASKQNDNGLANALETLSGKRRALADLATLAGGNDAKGIQELFDRFASPAEQQQASRDALELANRRCSAVVAGLEALSQPGDGQSSLRELKAFARECAFANQAQLVETVQLAELAKITFDQLRSPDQAAAALLKVSELAREGNIAAKLYLDSLKNDPGLQSMTAALRSLGDLAKELEKPGVLETLVEHLKPYLEQLTKLCAVIGATKSGADAVQDDAPLGQIVRRNKKGLVLDPLGPNDKDDEKKDGKDGKDDSKSSGSGDSQDKPIWKEYQVKLGDRTVFIPEVGKNLVLGRNPQKAHLIFKDATVSREHCQIEMGSDGPYLSDLGSRGGTYLIQGKSEPVLVTGRIKLNPGDRIRLGGEGGPIVTWGKVAAPEKPASSFPRLLSREEQEREEREFAEYLERNRYRLKYELPQGVWAEHDRRMAQMRDKDPAATSQARDASNSFLRNHQYDGRIPDGFQVIGGRNLIDEHGRHHDPERASFIVDTRAGKDPALEKFLTDCRKELGHLKDKPEELAKALAQRVKAAMEPAGWGPQQIDDGYLRLRDKNAGGRMMLGDFITASQKGEGAGACMQEATLLKVAFDSFYPEESSRPRMKLVRGFHGDNSAGLQPDEALNHAWVTLDTAGKERIFDPRLDIHGELRAQRPSHQPGNEIAQLRPEPPAKDQPSPGDRVVVSAAKDRLIGKEVGYYGQTWRIKEIKDGQVVITGDLVKTGVTLDYLQRHNPGVTEFRIGEKYKVERSDRRVEDGWEIVGYKDPVKRDSLIVRKKDAVERTVPLAKIQSENPHLFRDVAREGALKLTPVDASKAADYGLVYGRQVVYQGRKWFVHGSESGGIKLVAPTERTMSAEEYKRLNGDREPQQGDEIWYQRDTGETLKARVVDYNDASGQVRVRNETGATATVPLEILLHENPRIKEQHKPIDVTKLFLDPRSKITLESPYTAGTSGHDKWLGTLEGPGGEVVRIIVHKPPKRGEWIRLRNDLASRAIADIMSGNEHKPGDPGLFPATVKRDGMMVQEFIGDGETVHAYLAEVAYKDAEVRKEPSLQKRMGLLLDRADPKLRNELARAVAMSLVLGDTDQHGLNFVVERNGPNPEDVHILRIDADYAFVTDKTPNMDRLPNYGAVVNGVFSYFSGQELPENVRAEVRRVSDLLNPAGEDALNQARDRFARENELTREQVDGLAERAKFLVEGGKFPTSKNWKDLQEKSVLGARTRETDERSKQPRVGEDVEKPHTVLKGPDALTELRKDAGFAQLCNSDLVTKLHDRVSEMQTELQKVLVNDRAEAAKRLRNSTLDLLVEQGIENANLNAERIEFVFSKGETQPSTDYFTADGKPVMRQGREFVLSDGKTKVSRDKVVARVLLPDSLVAGPPGELSLVMYQACLEQANTGVHGAPEISAIREFVTRSLGKHVEISDAGRVAVGESSGLNVSTLPAEQPGKPVEIVISKDGLKIDGVEREVAFADVWKRYVEDLKEELRAEEAKTMKDNDRIRKLQEKIKSEEEFAARLDPNHSNRSEHEAAKKLAHERMQEFKAKSGDVERLAREKGGGSNARGRLVALTILASFFIAQQQKAKTNDG